MAARHRALLRSREKHPHSPTGRNRPAAPARRAGARRRRGRTSGRATPSLRSDPGASLSPRLSRQTHPDRRAPHSARYELYGSGLRGWNSCQPRAFLLGCKRREDQLSGHYLDDYYRILGWRHCEIHHAGKERAVWLYPDDNSRHRGSVRCDVSWTGFGMVWAKRRSRPDRSGVWSNRGFGGLRFHLEAVVGLSMHRRGG